MNSQKIYVAIIEDDPRALDYLTQLLLANFKSLEIVATGKSIKEGVQILSQNSIDLVFMDIELTDGLSFEIFKQIKNHKFEVIFVTAFDNYLTTAFEHYAFNYLQKPLDAGKLRNVIDRFLAMRTKFSKEQFTQFQGFFQSKSSSLLVHTGNSHINLKLSEIIWCSSEGNFTHVYCTDSTKHLASNSLKYYEELLLSKGFFRASRSALINIDHIRSIYKKETIILSNKEKIQVSTRNRGKLNDLIGGLS